MTPVRFEPTISAGEPPQTYALDRAATATIFMRHSTVSFICSLCILKANRMLILRTDGAAIWLCCGDLHGRQLRNFRRVREISLNEY
jgi:hypothetical protein